MKVRKLDPEKGDQNLDLTPAQATELILEEKKKGRLNFVKFSDGDVLQMMERTGILQQLEAKEKLGVLTTLVPAVGGG